MSPQVRLPSFRLMSLLANILDLIFKDAARNWLRNLRAVMPALGTMTLLLLIAGVFGLGGLAVRNVVQSEARNASVVHVYLRETVSDDEAASLQSRLRSDPRVESVRYVSREEALRLAHSRPGLPRLADDAATNPFPASLEVQLRHLEDAGAVAASASRDPAVEPADHAPLAPQQFLGEAPDGDPQVCPQDVLLCLGVPRRAGPLVQRFVLDRAVALVHK